MTEEPRDVGPPAAREIVEPPNTFRRASVVLGVLWLELTSLFWMVHSGAFALTKEPRPATYLGTSKVLAAPFVGVAGWVVLLYRQQQDRKAGVPLKRLYFFAFTVTGGIAAIGGLVLAANLLWIASILLR